jgi:hypothetical protein
MPKAMSGGRDPAASTEMLRATLFGGDKDGAVGLRHLPVHPQRPDRHPGLRAGLRLCLPTAGLMLYNGATLGAFFTLFASRGLGVEAGGWLLIHGVTELFAVTLAGRRASRSAGPSPFPGERRRLDAIAEAGRHAATVMGGVVVMLFVAGLLEGFGRQLITFTPRATAWRRPRR